MHWKRQNSRACMYLDYASQSWSKGDEKKTEWQGKADRILKKNNQGNKNYRILNIETFSPLY